MFVVRSDCLRSNCLFVERSGCLFVCLLRASSPLAGIVRLPPFLLSLRFPPWIHVLLISTAARATIPPQQQQHVSTELGRATSRATFAVVPSCWYRCRSLCLLPMILDLEDPNRITGNSCSPVSHNAGLGKK